MNVEGGSGGRNIRKGVRSIQAFAILHGIGSCGCRFDLPETVLFSTSHGTSICCPISVMTQSRFSLRTIVRDQKALCEFLASNNHIGEAHAHTKPLVRS